MGTKRDEEYRKSHELFKELQEKIKTICNLLGLDSLSSSWDAEILPELEEIKRKADRYDELEKGAR